MINFIFKIQKMTKTPKIHFISIGGAVMHNLALALHNKGFEITGSDDEIYDPARSRLQKAGLLPAESGWFPEKITTDLDAVILGMHARINNPELIAAQEMGIKIYNFPEYVYEQTADKKRVIIAGSHGKTTITSMILHVLKYHNMQFDYLVGAGIDGFETMVGLTPEAPIVVIEGDEYLASPLDLKAKFLFYHPQVVLISGIAWDHFNVYPTYESYVNAFVELTKTIPEGGALIYDQTDEDLNEVCDSAMKNVTKFPYKAHPFEVRNGKAYLKNAAGEVPLEVFGDHNMKNLMGCKHVLNQVGVTDEMFYEAIGHFKGAAKRLEKMGESSTSIAYRDFAHAPSKVAATTNAMKNLHPERRLIACYELHTYSSLNKDFLPQYADKLKDADVAVVSYSPKTLEIKKMPAVSAEEIKKAFGRDDLQIFTDAESIKAFLVAQNYENTNLLMMSSGTFGGLDLGELAKEIY
jgi:UDP-N-acetylmuramate: L-alanyl-gamma-D-glutamyl-meso-diaminopimelate ligase